jgi:hypothetical protein
MVDAMGKHTKEDCARISLKKHSISRIHGINENDKVRGYPKYTGTDGLIGSNAVSAGNIKAQVVRKCRKGCLVVHI